MVRFFVVVTIFVIGILPHHSLFARRYQVHSRIQSREEFGGLGKNSFVVCKSAASTADAINLAASSAISKLMSVCGIGYCAGRAGLLDQNTLSVLSKLIFTIIQPCFIFVQVASSIAKEAEQGLNWSLLVLPLMAVLQVFLGNIVGIFVTRLLYPTKLNSDDAKQLLACTTFGNSGPLPLVFTDAIFRTHSDSTLLKKGIAYISLYLLGWSPMFWILGPSILEDASSNTSTLTPKEKRKQLLTRVFNPPVLSSIFGLLFGAVKQLSQLCVLPGSPFHCIFDAAGSIGNAYLPCVLLILSGSLTASASSSSSGPPSSQPSSVFDTLIKKVEENRGFAIQVFFVYFSKFVLMPSISFLLIDLLRHHVPIISTTFRRDPMLLYVLLLETCMPSAQNLTVILQLQEKKKAATRLARVLMVIYLTGVPAICYWLVRILQLTSLF